MAQNETPKGLKGHSKLLAGILIILALAAMGLAPTVFSSTPAQPDAQSVDADLAGSGCVGGPEAVGGCGGVGNEPPGGCGGGVCAIPQPEAIASPDCDDCDGDCGDCPKAGCDDCDGDCDNCPKAGCDDCDGDCDNCPKAGCDDCDGDCDNCPKAGCDDCDGDCDDCTAAPSKTDDTHAQASAGTGPQINADKCTGCGKCAKIAPKTFALNRATEKAYVKNPKGDPEPIIRKAARACPAKAITIG